MQTEAASATVSIVASAVEALGLAWRAIAPELDSPPQTTGDADIDWASVDPHDLGEMRLASVSKGMPRRRQAAGAFYTPAGVARLMAEQTIPLVDAPGALPVCLDPTCGCGSLLIEAVRWLHETAGASPRIAAQCVRGYDREPAAVLIARLALILTAERMGAATNELRLVAEATARNITVRDVLAEPLGDEADCVLMNPPYVRAARASDNRKQIRSAFDTASGAFDLHVPFVELALRCLRPGGAFGILTTSKLLTADYAAKLRRMLADRATLTRLIDLEDCSDAAPRALISQVVITGCARPPTRGRRLQIVRPRTLQEIANGAAETVSRSQAELLGERWPTVRASASEARIVRKMTSGPRTRLGSLALVRGGLRGFDYHRCCEELVEANRCPEAVPVLTPGNVRAYRAPADGPVRLAGRDWREPCLPRRPDPIPTDLWALFAQPKVVVKGLGSRPTAALCPDKAVLFVAVWGVWGAEELLWGALGLLNSRPAAWLHYQQLATARIPRGSLRIPMAWVAEFPMPHEGADEVAAIARLRVMADTPDARDELQARIDRAAARAYGLTEAELRLMDQTPLRLVQA